MNLSALSCTLERCKYDASYTVKLKHHAMKFMLKCDLDSIFSILRFYQCIVKRFLVVWGSNDVVPSLPDLIAVTTSMRTREVL